MDRKIHRRMMDARYYLENGVAHPFTTGSRAQRSFRLPRLFFLLLLLPLLSSFPFMSTPVFISPRSVSAPFQRERERERERERPVSGIKIGRPSRTNVAQGGGIIHLTRDLLRAGVRVHVNKREGTAQTLWPPSIKMK